MLHKNVKLLLFFHEPGTCGDAVIKILDNSMFNGKKIVATHEFAVDKNGRASPQLRDEYKDLLDDPSMVEQHADVGKDMTIIQRWIDHAEAKNEILVLRLCEHWQTVVNIQNTIKNTFTITMEVPKNMHQCVLKNRHKTIADVPYVNDKNFEKLKTTDNKKALAFLYTKMLASGEGVSFNDKVDDYTQAEYLCSIEHLHTENFISRLCTELGIITSRIALDFHTNWLDRQSPLYKFNLTKNLGFRECFGFNSKSPHSDQNFELDWLDKSFLLYYQKTKKLPLTSKVNTTADTINYLQSINLK